MVTKTSPMGSPLYIRPILTFTGEDELRVDLTELSLLLESHDVHVFANDVHGLLFKRSLGHLENMGPSLSI